MRGVTVTIIIGASICLGGCDRISAEFAYFDAYWSTRAFLQGMFEQAGDDRNPFSAEHPLSAKKPDMTKCSLPVSRAEATHKLAFLESEFCFPAIARVQERASDGVAFAKTAYMKNESCFIHVSPHSIYDLRLDPGGFFGERPFDREMPGDIDPVFARFSALTPWDQIVRVFGADASGLDRRYSVGHRMLTLVFLGTKVSLCETDPNVPIHYYESPYLKCLLTGPIAEQTEVKLVDRDYDVENPDELNELMARRDSLPVISLRERIVFDAIVSSLDGHGIFAIRFIYPVDKEPNLILNQTLAYLGQCRFE